MDSWREVLTVRRGAVMKDSSRWEKAVLLALL